MKTDEKKPRWLEEREREQRETTAAVLSRHGLVEKKPSAAQTLEEAVSTTQDATATGNGNGVSNQYVTYSQHTPEIHRRFHLPKWTYVPIAILALAAGYISGAAAGFFPSPLPLSASTANVQQQQRPAAARPVPADPALDDRITLTDSKSPTQVVVRSQPGIESILPVDDLKLALTEVYSVNRVLTENDGSTLKKIEDINKTLYFMLTGKTFEEQNFIVKIVSREEYDLSVHPMNKGSAGTIRRQNDGEIRIYSIMSSPAALITTLASETGQAHAVKEGPRNIDVGITVVVDPEYGDVRNEFLDALYRGAVFNLINELGIKSASPSTSFANRIEKDVTFYLTSDHFFAKAWSAAWGVSLEDSETAARLEEKGWGGSKNLIRLYIDFGLLDFRENNRENNIRREAEFKTKLETLLERRESYMLRIVQSVRQRLSSEGIYAVTSGETLP